MPDQSGFQRRREDAPPASRIALKVSELHADLLGSLHEEIGNGGGDFVQAAQRLAVEFGSVTAAAVELADRGRQGDAFRSKDGEGSSGTPLAPSDGDTASTSVPTSSENQLEELPSLYRPGHMRRRLDQLIETNRRHGHPFGLAVFDASGPGTKPGDVAGGQETVLSILGAALRDSIRIVDEAFRLEEDAICVLAPDTGTVEGVQMCERLLGQLDDLERAGGLRICISAGVVACPDHGADAEELLHKADAAMWRARAVGQPVGVGALQDR
ncbi:MAG TPA: GGDEF domain-containing protein [Solirubrobacterales bacterium]|nr:GGDEF domain-containing protein [Solirubrobacterales bacterium]